LLAVVVSYLILIDFVDVVFYVIFLLLLRAKPKKLFAVACCVHVHISNIFFDYLI